MMLSKLFGRSAEPVARVEPVMAAAASEPSGTHKPAVWMSDAGWGGGGGSNVKTLPRVTATLAQRHATVFACCNVIASDLAKIPLKLYQKGTDGREQRVRDHPAVYLLNVESAAGVSAEILRFALAYAFCLRGNAFAYAPRDGAGELELIETLPNDGVSVLRNGRARFYDFEDGAGVRRRAPSRSIVHLRHLALDGWTGRSPIEISAESVGIALAGQEAAARSATGVVLSAYVSMEDSFQDDEAYERNAKRIKAAIENPEVNGIPILGMNDKIQRLDLSAADQQLLATRSFDREQIASIYRVPPPKLQILEHGVKANAEQAALDYLTDCLLHWGRQFEGQIAQGTLTDAERRAGFYWRHDFDTLLRPTTKERYEALSKAVGGPFISANEARLKEGYDPVEGGSVIYPPPNMTRKEEPAKGGDDA